MAIFISVLKIIGLILLCILLLILALIFIILFVPVRYKARVNKDTPDGDILADANASYLLHAVSARAKYDSDFDFYIKVLGFKIKKKESSIEESDKSEIKESEKSEIKESEKPEIKESGTFANKESENANVLEEAVSYDSLEYTIDWNEEEEKEAETEEAEEEAENKETLSDKVIRFIEKLSSKSDSIKSKIYNIESKYQRMSGLINDSRNKKAASYIYKVILNLLKHYIPKKVKGYVHFGFDDPGTTGKVLMYLGILYPVLPKKVTIEPDFDDTDIFGNLYIKGRIRLIHLAVAAIKLLIDKNVRRLWRLYKKSN